MKLLIVETQEDEPDAVVLDERAGVSDEGDQTDSLVLAGCHSLFDLVHMGRVKLHDESGAIVSIWDPVPGPDYLRPDLKRVSVAIDRFSELFQRCYPEPMPEEATCVIGDPAFVEVGSPLYGGYAFVVNGWERDLRVLRIPQISRIELKVVR